MMNAVNIAIFFLNIDDIQSCKNLIHEVKYMCKEDYRPMNYNFDWDMLTQIVLAYVCAQKYNTITNTTYPDVRLTPMQKRDFLKAFNEFVDERQGYLARVKSEMCGLRPWQVILHQNTSHRQRNLEILKLFKFLFLILNLIMNDCHLIDGMY